MDDACTLMSDRIADIVSAYSYLQTKKWEGDYVERDTLNNFPVGKLTQRELVNLFEYVVRFDAVME